MLPIKVVSTVVIYLLIRYNSPIIGVGEMDKRRQFSAG